MRPESHTSSGISTSMPPTATVSCHAGTPVIAMRIGIIVGAKNGIIDNTAMNELLGDDGKTDMPRTYPMMRNISTGVTVDATSSWRDTSAPTAANASAYALKPNTNQTTTQMMVLAAAETARCNVPTPKPTSTPTMPMVST